MDTTKMRALMVQVADALMALETQLRVALAVEELTRPARPARPGKGKARDKAKRTLPRAARQTAQRTR